MVDNCLAPIKMKTFKVLELPDKLVANSWYIVESDPTDDNVDVYITGRNGELKTIVDDDRIVEDPNPIVQYKIDTASLTDYYYYGYEYTVKWDIIRVRKDDVTNRSKASGSTTSFISNWNIRESLTYI